MQCNEPIWNKTILCFFHYRYHSIAIRRSPSSCWTLSASQEHWPETANQQLRKDVSGEVNLLAFKFGTSRCTQRSSLSSEMSRVQLFCQHMDVQCPNTGVCSWQRNDVHVLFFDVFWCFFSSKDGSRVAILGTAINRKVWIPCNLTWSRESSRKSSMAGRP